MGSEAMIAEVESALHVWKVTVDALWFLRTLKLRNIGKSHLLK